jgi:hypothetical protein
MLRDKYPDVRPTGSYKKLLCSMEVHTCVAGEELVEDTLYKDSRKKTEQKREGREEDAKKINYGGPGSRACKSSQSRGPSQSKSPPTMSNMTVTSQHFKRRKCINYSRIKISAHCTVSYVCQHLGQVIAIILIPKIFDMGYTMSTWYKE